MVRGITKVRWSVGQWLWAILVFSPIPARALTSSGTGLGTTAANAGYNVAGVSIPQYVGTVINVALGVVGIVFLILVVYGGMRWMLAQGDENKVNEARNMILHAIVGLIIVLAAYAMTNFVVGSLIEATLD